MKEGLNSKRIRLVLVGPEGKINMGFILRLAKNFSVNEICVVNPAFRMEDPEIIEFSAKGKDMIKKVTIKETLRECIEDSSLVVCTTSKSRPEKDVLRYGVPPDYLREVLPKEGLTSLVFGRESVGLTREELKECDVISTLITLSPYNVLNLSHAIAIYLYEISKPEAPSNPLECRPDTTKAIRKLIEEITTNLKDERGGIALKHIIFRAGLKKSECGAIYKFLKEIRVKLSRT